MKILYENCQPKDALDKTLPYTSYLVEYIKDGKPHYDVSLGDNKIIKVVCGAPNAREGLISVYAPPGSTIPKSNL